MVDFGLHSVEISGVLDYITNLFNFTLHYIRSSDLDIRDTFYIEYQNLIHRNMNQLDSKCKKPNNQKSLKNNSQSPFKFC